MKKHSKTNHCHCSNGETISRHELENRINDAKARKIQEQKDEYGFNFCVDCYNEGFICCDKENLEFGILDCSHNISVKECIESGHSELAYDTDNMTIRCRFHHRKFDKSDLRFRSEGLEHGEECFRENITFPL